MPYIQHIHINLNHRLRAYIYIFMQPGVIVSSEGYVCAEVYMLPAECLLHAPICGKLGSEARRRGGADRLWTSGNVGVLLKPPCMIFC